MEKEQGAREQAADRDSQIMEFLTQVSYEMRTPLNAIIDLTSILLRESLPYATRERLQQIDRAAHYLSQVVEDTQDISLYEAGNLHLESRQFSMPSLVADIQELIRPQCEKAGISFRISVASNIKETYVGDLRRIRQIILNLLNQSLLMTSRGGEIVLDMKETGCGSASAELTFSVIDNGIGIERQYLPHIFEPFSPDAGDLYGIGLPLAANLAQLMGGTIHVESRRNTGTRFTVEISVGLPEKAGNVPEEEAEPSALDYDFRGCRVLLVEDNPINADITQDLLQLHGFSVECAYNGEEALKAFEASGEGEFQAVLMDVRMPVMDGLEAVKQIRGLDRADAAGVPVIAMSANAFEEDVAKSKDAGMNIHLSKPVDPEKLFSILADYLLKEE